MRRLNTHKQKQARVTLAELGEKELVGKSWDVVLRRQAYRKLRALGHIWDIELQKWRKAEFTHVPKESRAKKGNWVLVRVMASQEILDRDRENLALAFEVIGYEIISISSPVQNRENGYWRIYIKAGTS